MYIEGCCVKSGVFAFPRCVFTLSALFLYQTLLFKIKVTDHGRLFLDLGLLFDHSNHLWYWLGLFNDHEFCQDYGPLFSTTFTFSEIRKTKLRRPFYFFRSHFFIFSLDLTHLLFTKSQAQTPPLFIDQVKKIKLNLTTPLSKNLIKPAHTHSPLTYYKLSNKK